MSAARVIPPSVVDAEPPIIPDGLARTTIIVSSFLGGLAIVLVSLRLIVRTWLLNSGPRALGCDDLFLVLALIPFLSACITGSMACYYGIGTRDENLSPLQMIKASQYNTYWQLSYALSIPFCKIAIAAALFRITTRTLFRTILWSVITLSCIVLGIGIFSLALRCKPWPATWNPTLGTCGSYDIVVAISYAASGATIITDWACAILPYFVLKDLQVAAHVRYCLIGVLSLGGFASVAAMVRLPYFQYQTTDVLYHEAYTVIWSNVESGVGIVATSIPPLRRLFTCLRSTVGSSGRGEDNTGPKSDFGHPFFKGSNPKCGLIGSRSMLLVPIKMVGTASTSATTLPQ